MKPDELTHWWWVDARYTVCGELVQRDTICRPDPTCPRCKEWLVADAQSLERQHSTDVKRWTYD